MSPTQELFAFAVAIYLYECVAALPRSTVFVQSTFWRHLRIAGIEHWPGTLTKALTFGMPLPPLGAVYALHYWPVSISPTGVSNRCIQQPESELHCRIPETFFRMEEIQDVRAVGSVLRINGSNFVVCGCETAARRWGGLIREVADAPADARGALIRAAIDRDLDGARSLKTYASISRLRGDLRFCCNVLWVFLFGYCPLIVWWQGARAVWWVILAMLVPLWVFTLIEFARAHRMFYPDDSKDRRKRTLMLGLTPFAAARACDEFTRYAFDGHHPLAVAEVLCVREDYEHLAARVYRELCFPVDTGSEDALAPARSTECWLRARMLTATEACLRAAGIEPPDLIVPPPRDDATSRSYCPRCGTQHELVDGACSTCAGVALKAFAEAES